MSSSKNVSKKLLLDAVDGTTNPSTISNPFSVLYQDNAGIVLSWTGTLQGTFHVFVTNDSFGVGFPPNASTWAELDFGTSIVVDPSIQADGIVINLNQLPFSGLYVSYTNASGTGNITAQIVSKRIG
jgi:hypothetical protein